ALIKLGTDADADVRRSSLEALRRLREPRAVSAAVTALGDSATAVTALVCLGELGGPEHAQAIVKLAARQPAADVLAAAGQAFGSWALRTGVDRQDVYRAFADLHGGAGVLVGWHVLGPVPAKTADDRAPKVAAALPGWRLTVATGDGRLRPGPPGGADS